MQIIRKVSLLVLLLTAVSWQVQAQRLLKGRITDAQHEPLISASISIKGTTQGISSDSDGNYEISIPSGNQTLIAYYMGYDSKEIKLTSELLESGKLNIVLKENSIMLSEVAIEGKSPVQQIRETPFNVTAIAANKLHNISTDLNQVLNRTTGVRVRESGGTGSDFSFSLNGFSGKQVKFFLDGIPIDNYGSSFTLNNIPVNMAERIEVYKGVVPISLGGDALGGAVNIVTKQNMRKYIDASYSIGSFNTHKASFSGRFANKNGYLLNINAFGNYAKNDYKVNVESIDKTGTGKFLPPRKHKRFHDGYKSGTLILEAGVKDKSFADYLLVGMTLTGNHDEIQQGSTMNRVVGGAFRSTEFDPDYFLDLESSSIKGKVLSAYHAGGDLAVMLYIPTELDTEKNNWAFTSDKTIFKVAIINLPTQEIIEVTNLPGVSGDNFYGYASLYAEDGKAYKSFFTGDAARIYEIDLTTGVARAGAHIRGGKYIPVLSRFNY